MVESVSNHATYAKQEDIVEITNLSTQGLSNDAGAANQQFTPCVVALMRHG